MESSTVFTKTARGLLEATGRTSRLSRDMRILLNEIDGRATVAELQAKFGKVPQTRLQEALQVLARNDLIREFRQAQPPAPPQRAAGVDTDLDFTVPKPGKSALSGRAGMEALQQD